MSVVKTIYSIMKLEKNQKYTRTQIKDIVGGELQTYLPQKNKIILAGCFNLELNPDAPNQIQAGIGPIISKKAFLLSQQPETIFPVFLKDKENNKEYVYIGNYKYKPNTITNDPSKIKEAENKSGRHKGLSYLFDLIKAPFS